jgi:endonuclease/exonuclease/phosphatase family metal-dependent hydrolase
VTFATIHRHHRSENGFTIKAIQKAVDSVSHPIVLLGDFNLREDDPAWRFLNTRFRDTVKFQTTKSAQEVLTVGTTVYGTRIDYILVEPEYVEVNDVGIISPEHRKASDHIGYYARIKLK